MAFGSDRSRFQDIYYTGKRYLSILFLTYIVNFYCKFFTSLKCKYLGWFYKRKYIILIVYRSSIFIYDKKSLIEISLFNYILCL